MLATRNVLTGSPKGETGPMTRLAKASKIPGQTGATGTTPTMLWGNSTSAGIGWMGVGGGIPDPSSVESFVADAQAARTEDHCILIW